MPVLAKWMNKLEGFVDRVEWPRIEEVIPCGGRTNLRTLGDECFFGSGMDFEQYD